MTTWALWNENPDWVIGPAAAAALLFALAAYARSATAAVLVVAMVAAAVAVMSWAYRLPDVPSGGAPDKVMAPCDGEVTSLRFDAASNMFRVEVTPRWTQQHYMFAPVPGVVAEHREAMGGRRATTAVHTRAGAEVLLLRVGAGTSSAVVGAAVQQGQRMGMMSLGGTTEVHFSAAQFAPAVAKGDSIEAGRTVVAHSL
jgi:hypothetical protein